MGVCKYGHPPETGIILTGALAALMRADLRGEISRNKPLTWIQFHEKTRWIKQTKKDVCLLKFSLFLGISPTAFHFDLQQLQQSRSRRTHSKNFWETHFVLGLTFLIFLFDNITKYMLYQIFTFSMAVQYLSVEKKIEQDYLQNGLLQAVKGHIYK